MSGLRSFYAKGRLPHGQMNKTEAAYEAHLKNLLHASEIYWYAFERLKIRLADRTFYTPDFSVINKNSELEFHDVKGSLGFIMEDARVKICCASEQNPFIFYLVAPIRRGGWEMKRV